MELKVAKDLVGQQHLEGMFQTLSQGFIFQQFREPPTSLALAAAVVTALSELGFRDDSDQIVLNRELSI